MRAQEHSFRTYKFCSPGVAEETSGERNARTSRELAMRYIDQANTAMRLAKEALERARRYEERA